MAKTNKYTSINFNDIYEKKTNHPTATNTLNNNPSSSSSSKSHLSRSRTHGGMLVLTRPSPKPLPSLQPSKPIQQPPTPSSPPVVDLTARAEPETNSPSISLRPLGRPLSTITLSREPSQTQMPVLSSKPEPFVPPHLRPGFVGREERFGQQRHPRKSEFGSPNRVGDDGLPKSGGGHDRMLKGSGGESDHGEMNRPASSGRYGSSSSNSSTVYRRSPPHY